MYCFYFYSYLTRQQIADSLNKIQVIMAHLVTVSYIFNIWSITREGARNGVLCEDLHFKYT